GQSIRSRENVRAVVGTLAFIISEAAPTERMRPCQGRDNGAIPFTRSISVGSVAQQQSARLTCERQRGQHSPLPPCFRGHSSVSRAGASHAPDRRRDSFCPHHFCPCGVVQPTRLPLMQEITGARPVRDANSI